MIEDLEKDPLHWSLVYQDVEGEKYFFFVVSTALPPQHSHPHSCHIATGLRPALLVLFSDQQGGVGPESEEDTAVTGGTG